MALPLRCVLWDSALGRDGSKLNRERQFHIRKARISPFDSLTHKAVHLILPTSQKVAVNMKQHQLNNQKERNRDKGDRFHPQAWHRLNIYAGQ